MIPEQRQNGSVLGVLALALRTGILWVTKNMVTTHAAMQH